MTQPEDTSDSRNKLLISLITAIVCLPAGWLFSYFTDIKPYISYSYQKISEIDSTLNCLNKSIANINEKYTTKDYYGYECRVGRNSELSINNVSVYTDNKYNLKRGDKIELTYFYGVTEISIKCIVSFVEKNRSQESEAELFISNECMDALRISQKDRRLRGTFLMTFKRVIQ